MVIFCTLITVFLKIGLTICLPVLAVRNPKQTISGRFKAWSSHWLVGALLRWDERSSFVFVFCVYFPVSGEMERSNSSWRWLERSLPWTAPAPKARTTHGREADTASSWQPPPIDALFAVNAFKLHFFGRISCSFFKH